MELNLKPEEVQGQEVLLRRGAATSATTLGFKGRTGLYELLIMNDDLRDMISRGRQHRRDPAVHAARPACRACARPACGPCSPGITTLDEVVRETVLEDESVGRASAGRSWCSDGLEARPAKVRWNDSPHRR